MLRSAGRWIATGLGLGLSPVMPGTCGTLAGVGLALLLPGRLWTGLAAAALVVAGAPLARWYERDRGRKDPPSFVLDEVAGYLVAVLGLDLAGRPLFALECFFAFRLFDIAKPWPCRPLEALPRGWGVMADDLAAGVFANLSVQLAYSLSSLVLASA